MRTRQVTGCEFSYRCPRQWELLTPTADADIRHCGTCAREVYLCHDAEQLVTHARAGHCVAILRDDAERGERMLLGVPRSEHRSGAGGDPEYEPIRRKRRTP